MAEKCHAEDGLIADTIGRWSIDKKHEYLRRYIQATAATQKKYLGSSNAGATFIDLFCGTGRARIKDTLTWVNGSAAVAWDQSVLSASPFSDIFIADLRNDARAVCANRLRSKGAPVREIEGDAREAAEKLVGTLDPNALHLVFIDPYGLRALNFRIFQTLAALRRVDLIVHVSAMDLQRNLDANLSSENSDFDLFCPGWRTAIPVTGGKEETRARVVELWRGKLANLGVWPSTEMRLITGENGQRLYWLVIASRHPIAHKFWKIAVNPEGQGSLF